MINQAKVIVAAGRMKDRFLVFGLCAMLALLLVGCSPTTTSQRVNLTPGQGVSNTCYRLVRITPEGKAEFHNIDAGDRSDIFPDFTVGVGGSFGFERESRDLTVYKFTVEGTDPAKQEATVLVQTTTSRRSRSRDPLR